MMNLSVLILYFLLLRIYPVRAIKDNNLVIRQSSYEKITFDPMKVKHYDLNQSKSGNKDAILRVEYDAEYINAKRNQPKMKYSAKRHKKGKFLIIKCSCYIVLLVIFRTVYISHIYCHAIQLLVVFLQT